MSERYRMGLPIQYEQRERIDIPRWQHAGRALAEFILTQESPSIFLDMDGVLMKSDSFHEQKLITPHIIPALQKIEAAGNGFVIGIEGSLDISKEVPVFLNMADVRITDSYEFAQTLNYATYYLWQKSLAA